ncbi:MAG: tripartite tricarboxylate transporter TctB family protein [Gammaproteobacteria bacterium]
MKPTHLGAGVVLVPACLWCLLWLIPNHTVPPTSEFDLSPALVPSIAIGAMLLTAAIMLLRALWTHYADAQPTDEEFGEEATGIDTGVLANLLWLALSAAVAWWLMTHIGFEPAMTVLLVVTMFYIGVRKPLTIVLTSILMPVVLSLAAWQFFSTQMPGFWR